MPDTVRNRLLHHGYIRLDGGLFQGDRYVLADCISGVHGDTVMLLDDKDDLIKL